MSGSSDAKAHTTCEKSATKNTIDTPSLCFPTATAAQNPAARAMLLECIKLVLDPDHTATQKCKINPRYTEFMPRGIEPLTHRVAITEAAYIDIATRHPRQGTTNT